MAKVFLNRPIVHILFVLILSILAYSNTFFVPFQFDDFDVILENPIIQDFQYFLSPSQAKAFTGHFGYHTFRSRYIGYLTFALNYSIHGPDPTGYHIVNLLIHICAALLVYLLVLLTFETPFLRTSGLRDSSRQIALLAALLFACHPLQTEAVTYIWQRVASLAALFSLLSLTAYIQWRLRGYQSPAAESGNPCRLTTPLLYLTCLVSAVLAMKTKQTAFTLPIMIVLYEFVFFHGKIRRRVLSLLPLLLTLPIIPLSLLDLQQPLGDVIGDVGEVSRDLTGMSRLNYLFTQFRVLVTYLRLILLPINQNLDYDYPLLQGFFTLEVVGSFVLLAAVFCSGIYLLYRSGHASAHLRIISFGIFWFFITLSVESSVIPIKEIIFEYRVYLPSAGVFVALSTMVFMAMKNMRERSKTALKAAAGLLVVVLLLLTGTTALRNSLWRDEITLWEDVVRKSPKKGRAHIGLGNAYKSEGLITKAIEQYNRALRLDPYDLETYNILGNVYFSLGNYDMAIYYLQRALQFNSNFADSHYNLGLVYQSQGLNEEAIEHYKIAMRLNPDHADVHNNIGFIYYLQGFVDEAIKEYTTAVFLSPDFAKAHYNLGVAYRSKGFISKANEHFKIARRLEPALFHGRQTQD